MGNSKLLVGQFLENYNLAGQKIGKIKAIYNMNNN
jgi:hypothetical protein